MTHSVLIIDDEPTMRMSLLDALKADGYEAQEASNGEEGLKKIEAGHYDVVITDLKMPGSDGLQVVRRCKECSPETQVIVMTAHGSVDTAVQAMKLGAHDYVSKSSFSMDEVLLTVERATEVQVLRQENTVLRQALEGKFNFEGIVGKNEQMRQILDKVKLVATTDTTVLVLGESGTGKEVIANAIHRNSPRCKQAFIKISCAALPETLLETELFGHEKGAFTGAVKQRLGRFELAHKGTLFLDEIGEVSPLVQVKLLRVLQERRFERVGGSETIGVDVRLVCATQKDLKKEVGSGRFREDLFYRLNVMCVTLPPLRERKEDILILADQLLQRSTSQRERATKRFSNAAREALLRYSFPGNIRELENMIERATVLAQERDAIQLVDLCGQASCPSRGGPVHPECGFCQEGLSSATNHQGAGTLAAVRERCEKDYIVTVLAREEWNRTAAAKSLGLSRKVLWEKCKRYGIGTSPDTSD